ncbi:DUF2953 domain-containing protein [Ornithinibacillus xuwenensis]|uniref:DUF2953 domain-containing protein n=1 Tax=Ornithinibacillus xuwenensis TaxID=3144668 RepID=A0ABU9XQN9_9BACI
MVWIFVVLFLIIIFIILLLLKIKIKVSYSYQKDSHQIMITVYLIRIKIFQRKIDFNAKRKDTHEQKDFLDVIKEIRGHDEIADFKQLLKTLKQRLMEAKNAMITVMNNLSIHQLTWKTQFGTGEASSTGVTSGGIWMIKGTLIGMMYEMTNFKCEPQIAVIPYFQQKGLQSQIDCIVSIRLGKAIYTVMQVLRYTNINNEAYI